MTIQLAPDWFDPSAFDSATTHTITSGGVPIAYRTGGDGEGPRILFVHGGRAHATWWAHIIGLLGDAAPKWAALDLSGHGDSGWREEYRASVWLEELSDVATALSVDDDLVLVGHSLGGMLSILLAARGTIPAITRIITIDAVPLHPGAPQAQPEPSVSKPSYPTLAEGAAAFSSRAARASWPEWLARFIGERSLRAEGDAWVWRHDNASRVIERPVIDDMGTLDLSRLTLITGAASPYRASIESSPFVQHAGARLRQISIDAGHDVMMERPLEFASILAAELAR